ncbi:unnamed protein product [marine sediment metagenome]|uniref:Uncharacterized protein n=1 Tax=marine sediment metagenome TaxID=412755 RepID=X0SYW0_9ZZZZ
MKKMNLDRASSEEIVNMFEVSFEEQVAKLNDIGAFNVECNDRQIGKPVQVEVNIAGHAGTPTIDQFRNGEVEGCESVTISRDDIGEMKFSLVKKLTTFVSGNDYLIVYESNN